MRKVLDYIASWLDSCLRRFCGKMNRDTRVIMVVCIIILSSLGSVFVFIDSIYQLGKEKGRKEIRVEHINQPELLLDKGDKTVEYEKE